MIGRGTTPTIQFRFRTIDTADITVCYLTMREDDLVIEKTLEDARNVGSGVLEWSLTQEETLMLGEEPIDIQVRYKTADGHAFISKVFSVSPYQILKDGVI